jgi:hypothetical protein
MDTGLWGCEIYSNYPDNFNALTKGKKEGYTTLD